MEILSRKLRTITSTPQVSYHPKCPRMQLTHLIFADNLMIFTRDDVPSVQAITDALNTFGAWSGLVANKDKTSIYFGGTSDTVKAASLNNTGYTEGTFPFIYLGILIDTTRLTKDNFSVLITKLQGAIHHWSSKLLSCAGRLQLINLVIFGLENFWCTGLLLPIVVANLINKFCKDLFWGVHGVLRSWSSKVGKAYVHPGMKEDLALRSLWHGIGHNCSGGSGCLTDNIWTVGAKDNFSESLRGILAARDYCINMTGGITEAKDALHICVTNGLYSMGDVTII
ncbi:uncharacterized protein LOC141590189 [Silene latifolia]|uniref:uncharacterized protein LOC141590189 n=1 Tax=Silene latifolia TaxID=37657 RepID=UPI003D76DADB